MKLSDFRFTGILVTDTSESPSLGEVIQFDGNGAPIIKWLLPQKWAAMSPTKYPGKSVEFLRPFFLQKEDRFLIEKAAYVVMGLPETVGTGEIVGLRCWNTYYQNQLVLNVVGLFENANLEKNEKSRLCTRNASYRRGGLAERKQDNRAV